MALLLQWLALAHHLLQRDSELLLPLFAPSRSLKATFGPATFARRSSRTTSGLDYSTTTGGTASPYARCAWCGQIVTFEAFKIVNLAETSQHVTKTALFAPRMTKSMNTFARELATQAINLTIIRHEILTWIKIIPKTVNGLAIRGKMQEASYRVQRLSWPHC